MFAGLFFLHVAVLKGFLSRVFKRVIKPLRGLRMFAVRFR